MKLLSAVKIAAGRSDTLYSKILKSAAAGRGKVALLFRRFGKSKGYAENLGQLNPRIFGATQRSRILCIRYRCR
ncbi:hypothetical protein LEP1GSC175_0201 [Leptospira santarosai str. HAI821]|nr:hypothetical protein LEP1GSC175_0201 [Leptospira santarosai str. HAI821]